MYVQVLRYGNVEVFLSAPDTNSYAIYRVAASELRTNKIQILIIPFL